jgi:hypothetical protein
MKPLPKTLNHGDAQFSLARQNFPYQARRTKKWYQVSMRKTVLIEQIARHLGELGSYSRLMLDQNHKT